MNYAKKAVEEFPRVHVGYKSLPPQHCSCGECYVTGQQRYSFELDAELASEQTVRDVLSVFLAHADGMESVGGHQDAKTIRWAVEAVGAILGVSDAD